MTTSQNRYAYQNPYTSLMLTTQPDVFFGRMDEIITILQVISAPEPTSHAIYGIRTIGKTTLLKYLKAPHGATQDYQEFIHSDYQYGSGKQLYFVYLNLHLFTQEDDLFYLLLAELDNSLSDEDSPITEFLFPEYDKQMSKQEVHSLLRSTLRELDERGIRVVFLLDDFDTVMLTLHPEDDHLLHSLSQITPFVIATEKPFPELRPEMMDSSPLLGILRPEVLGQLSESSAKALIMEPARRIGISYSDIEIGFLLDIGGRHPFLLVSTCESYFNICKEFPDFPKMITTTEKYSEPHDYLIGKLLSSQHVRSVLQRTWANLLPEERHILMKIAVDKTNLQSTNDLIIAERLVNKALAEIYFQLPHGRTYRCSTLVREFLLRHTASPQRASQTVAQVDIRQVSENLSPIDRKVFNYLVKHHNQICTFEELLKEVWVDGDGSKRALEASIHRLRRHLPSGEEIRNVRGKGYKYVVATANALSNI